MGVFDKMLDRDLRSEFCDYKKDKWRRSQEEFEEMSSYLMSRQCEEDILRLKKGDYYISIPNRFRIKKTHSTKRRICYNYPLREKSLFKLMNYVLMDNDHWFSESLYSFRKHKDHRDFFRLLKKKDFGRKYYVLKTDIHAYGESVDQDILLNQLRLAFSDDPEFVAFLEWLLKRNLFYERGKLVHERVSIIPGTPIGAFFNNIYLMELDQYLENHAELYMRFADDIAVFTKSYEEAVALKEYILQIMAKYKLECNEEKTDIYKPGETFSILGIQASPYEFDIAPTSMNKIIYKLKRKRDRLLLRGRKKKIPNSELLKIGVRYVNTFFFGEDDDENRMCWTAWAFGIITTTESLKLLDSIAQDCLRSIGSGKLGDARYRISYNKLKSEGYRSLVHYYYHYEEESELL